MKKNMKNKAWALFSFCALLFTSCGKQWGGVDLYEEAETKTESISFDSQGGVLIVDDCHTDISLFHLVVVTEEGAVPIMTDRNGKWISSDWLVVSKYSNEQNGVSIRFTALPNDTGDSRSAYLVARTEGYELMIHINQAP